MPKVSSKKKIYVGFAGWLVFLAIVFSFVFPWFASRNEKTRERIRELRREQGILQAEKDSYEKAQADLKELAERPLQPENFFSRDITLVNEIRYLENLGRELGVTFSINGISGTVNTAGKAKTQGDILVVPYTVSVKGGFVQILKFMDNMENLPFLSTLNTLGVTAADQGSVLATFSAYFYIKK